MKGYKGLIPIALAACLVLSVYMLVSSRMTSVNEYNNYLKEARRNAELQIEVDAMYNYEMALAIENTMDIRLEVGEFLLSLGEEQSAIEWGEIMIEEFPNSSDAYEYLLSRYKGCNDFHRCYALYDTIKKRELSTKSIEKIMSDIQYVFYLGEAYDEVGTYSQGYCAARLEDRWGLVDEQGFSATPFVYDEIGPFFDGLAPVYSKKGERFYIDNQGNKKMAVLVDGNVENLTSVLDNVFSVFDGSVWNIYNKEFKKLGGGYTDVSLMANGVIGVQENSQWTVLDMNFKKVNGKSYIDLVQDDRGVIYRNGVMFVYEDNGYYMVNLDGKKITNEKFLNAKLFLDDTYAAVQTDYGWTFVDNTGKMVFKNLYFDEARSFSNGFAAVQKFGQWGYIDLNGEVVIDYQFRDALDFNASGCAFVQYEDIWEMLRLYSKNYDT